MRTKKRDLAWSVVLGITGVLLVSCGAGSPSTPSHDSTPQPGPVELRVQFPTPHSSNPFTVVVTNGESQTISAWDHQTGCTILTAEHQTDGQWRPLRNCAVKTLSFLHSIPSGHTLTVSLDGATWPAGTYRMKLEYALGQQRSPTKIAYSASFVLPLT